MRIFPKETNITPQIDILCNQSHFSTWTSLRLLCASVNSVDDGAKEAAKALRKALRTELPRHQMNAIITTNPQVKLCLMERLASWAAACSTDPSLIIIPNLYNGLVRDRVVPFYDPSAPGQYPAIQPVSSSPPNSPMSWASPSRQGSSTYPLIHPPTTRLSKNEIMQHAQIVKSSCQMLTETIAFTDPDTATKDDLALVREFRTKCMDLQRDTQLYLNEATSKPGFDEDCLSQLLFANEDIINAIKSHNDLMEKLHLNQASTISRQASVHVAATTTTTTATYVQAPVSHESSVSQPTSWPHQPTRTYSDETHFKVLMDQGAGVGSGYSNSNSDHQGSSAFSRGKTVVLSSSPPASSFAVASVAASEPSFDPFADDSHYVTESIPDQITAAIRNGKRPVLNTREEPMTEQERNMIQLAKAQSLVTPARMETSATSSSSSSSAAAAAAAAIASARPTAPSTHQLATPIV
ncbi:hypothetical protein BGZ95_005575 [Linnemannia exigua]|uniref:GAT domain-containing protein n=1 Tax=Linnemannia exigua TaxID=604196 RepID=A0AAD4DH22_9FUNG|nr:hypothetical protein BGZ95_005575 [Linnemannia exigua]